MNHLENFTPESLPFQEQLMIREKETLDAFFGIDIRVPEPPERLFTALANLSQLGIAGFESHSLPKISLTEENELPGWKVKPEPWFWKQIKSRRVAKDAATLQEGWYLVDGRREPNNQDSEQGYYKDYFEPIMQELRNKGIIQKYRDVPEISRFGASVEEIEKYILPTFARRVGTKEEEIVRNIRLIELNVWGNMFHPEWGESNTWGCLADKLKGGRRLIGGYAHTAGGFDRSVSGLAAVGYVSYTSRSKGFGFHPLIFFPSEN